MAVPRPAIWERLQSDPIGLRAEPDIFIPIDVTETNNEETMAFSDQQITTAPIKTINDDQINNPSAHRVSLCVNDLRTTLYIDEDALNTTKTTMNSNTSSGKGNQSEELNQSISQSSLFSGDQDFHRSNHQTVATFQTLTRCWTEYVISSLLRIELFFIIALVHVRKRNNLVNGPIVSADYRSYSETTRRRPEPDLYQDRVDERQQTSWTPSLHTQEETKFVRPYFLIRPQSVLLLPNETGSILFARDSLSPRLPI